MPGTVCELCGKGRSMINVFAPTYAGPLNAGNSPVSFTGCREAITVFQINRLSVYIGRRADDVFCGDPFPAPLDFIASIWGSHSRQTQQPSDDESAPATRLQSQRRNPWQPRRLQAGNRKTLEQRPSVVIRLSRLRLSVAGGHFQGTQSDAATSFIEALGRILAARVLHNVGYDDLSEGILQ